MIKYPVDPYTLKWVLYDKKKKKVVKKYIHWPRFDGMPVENMDKDLVLLEVKKGDKSGANLKDESYVE